MPRRPKTEEEGKRDRFYRRLHIDMARHVWNTPEQNLSDIEVLANLLSFSVHKKCDYFAVAERLLQRFGNLERVFNARMEILMEVPDIKLNTALTIKSIPAICKKAMLEQRPKQKRIRTPQDAEAYMRPHFIGYDFEQAYLLLLRDTDFPACDALLLAEGTGNEVLIEPQKILHEAVVAKSKKLILCHSHPLGMAFPSQNDLISTVSVSGTLKAAGIRLMDHLIFSGNQCVYLSENEQMDSGILAFSTKEPESIFKTRGDKSGAAKQSAAEREPEPQKPQEIHYVDPDYTPSIYDEYIRQSFEHEKDPR